MSLKTSEAEWLGVWGMGLGVSIFWMKGIGG